jgi:hypothetical protein
MVDLGRGQDRGEVGERDLLVDGFALLVDQQPRAGAVVVVAVV